MLICHDHWHRHGMSALPVLIAHKCYGHSKLTPQNIYGSLYQPIRFRKDLYIYENPVIIMWDRIYFYHDACAQVHCGAVVHCRWGLIKEAGVLVCTQFRIRYL